MVTRVKVRVLCSFVSQDAGQVLQGKWQHHGMLFLSLTTFTLVASGEGITKLLGLTQQLVSKKSRCRACKFNRCVQHMCVISLCSDDQGMLLLCAVFNAVPFAQLQVFAYQSCLCHCARHLLLFGSNTRKASSTCASDAAVVSLRHASSSAARHSAVFNTVAHALGPSSNGQNHQV